MNTALSAQPWLAALNARFDDLVARRSAHVTQVVGGDLALDIHHDDPAFGIAMSRALFPPRDPMPSQYLAIHCHPVDDLIPDELLIARSGGQDRSLIWDPESGRQWLLDAGNDVHIGVDFATGVGVLAWSESAPGWFYAAPFRTALEWCATRAGDLLLHAAGVGRRNGGVVLLGHAGAGKSTSTMAAVAAGGFTLGDDYLWVGVDGDTITGRSCFRTCKTRHRASVEPVGITAGLPGFDIQAEEGKRVHYLAEGTDSFVQTFPIVGAVVLEPVADSSLPPRQVAASYALRRSAASTILQATQNRQQQMGLLTGLLTTVPCFSLHLDPDLERMGHGLMELVDAILAGWTAR